MGKKYIIELPENTHWIQWIMEGTKDHHPYMDFKQVEDLTPYTEPDFEQVRKEAYEQGYYIGYSKCLNRSYEDGLNDAWEAAKKIAKLDSAEQKRIYGGFGIYYIAHEFSAHEAIEKIRQYEQEQEEIKVGDEVKLKNGVSPAIYMQGTNGFDEIYLLFNDGSCGIHGRDEIECKTGRSFPEIATVLEKMRGEQE